jgi:hypothetical protein
VEKAMESDDKTPMDETTPRVLARIQRDLTEHKQQTAEGFKSLEARLGGRIDGLEARLDGRIDHLEARFDGLERRVTESEIRLSTEISAVAGTLRDVHALLLARSRRRLPSDTPED